MLVAKVLYRKRSVYSGTSLLANLKFHAGSGQYKTFQTTPADLNYWLI